MNYRQQQIENFFNKYCDLFNEAIKNDVTDVNLTTELYSECFIGANPLGVQCGKNDAHFRDVLVKGYKYYKEIGITNMKIILKEITFLDELHAMTKLHWKSSYIKKDGTSGDVEFVNIYITQSNNDQPKVFVWITGDEMAVFKEIGLT